MYLKSLQKISIIVLLIAGCVGTASASQIEQRGAMVNTGGAAFKSSLLPAVAKADAWAMMGVGLGLVGLVLRRKNKKSGSVK